MNALFSRKQKKEEAAAPAPTTAISARTSIADLSHILRSPRITEKATIASSNGVYVFDVAVRATKRDVLQAVAKYYKVQPKMVRIVSIPEKMVRNPRTGKTGIKQGGKKAYVYLKKGETITIA